MTQSLIESRPSPELAVSSRVPAHQSHFDEAVLMRCFFPNTASWQIFRGFRIDESGSWNGPTRLAEVSAVTRVPAVRACASLGRTRIPCLPRKRRTRTISTNMACRNRSCRHRRSRTRPKLCCECRPFFADVVCAITRLLTRTAILSSRLNSQRTLEATGTNSPSRGDTPSTKPA